MKNSHVLLIDSDIVAYQASATNEVNIDWGDGVTSHYGDGIEAMKDRIDETIDRLLRRFKPAATGIFLSCSRESNFRKLFYPLYKENRAGGTPPLTLAAARNYLISDYGGVVWPMIEADDVIGILATSPQLRKLHLGSDKPSIIVSGDKDMQTIPGLWYRPGNVNVQRITPEFARRFHLYQTLTGDPVDGYPGAPGIGPKKAAWVMSQETEPKWDDIVEAYSAAEERKTGVKPERRLVEARALTQARCAYILHEEFYDPVRKIPIPWVPA